MKKLIKLFVMSLMAFSCFFTLSGCDDKSNCDHKFGNWKTVESATCTESGLKERKCEKCGHTESKTIDALGHNYFLGRCTDCGEKKD